METKTRTTFSDGNTHGLISILKETYIEYGGNQILVEEPERRSFNPLQLTELKEYAPELYEICKSMWTPEVQKKYQDWLDSQAKLEA